MYILNEARKQFDVRSGTAQLSSAEVLPQLSEFRSSCFMDEESTQPSSANTPDRRVTHHQPHAEKHIHPRSFEDIPRYRRIAYPDTPGRPPQLRRIESHIGQVSVSLIQLSGEDRTALLGKLYAPRRKLSECYILSFFGLVRWGEEPERHPCARHKWHRSTRSRAPFRTPLVSEEKLENSSGLLPEAGAEPDASPIDDTPPHLKVLLNEFKVDVPTDVWFPRVPTRSSFSPSFKSASATLFPFGGGTTPPAPLTITRTILCLANEATCVKSAARLPTHSASARFESDFESLRLPHPARLAGIKARSLLRTFSLDSHKITRTQTESMQARNRCCKCPRYDNGFSTVGQGEGTAQDAPFAGIAPLWCFASKPWVDVGRHDHRFTAHPRFQYLLPFHGFPSPSYCEHQIRLRDAQSRCYSPNPQYNLKHPPRLGAVSSATRLGLMRHSSQSCGRVDFGRLFVRARARASAHKHVQAKCQNPDARGLMDELLRCGGNCRCSQVREERWVKNHDGTSPGRAFAALAELRAP
ncbi:hypothetical protein DFH09DRAFT_1283907 [Mycena vulgaris]|nr:hypothetical protein DFH09DRAFT_1283907 [Mycena vulgaris]